MNCVFITLSSHLCTVNTSHIPLVNLPHLHETGVDSFASGMVRLEHVTFPHNTEQSEPHCVAMEMGHRFQMAHQTQKVMHIPNQLSNAPECNASSFDWIPVNGIIYF